MEHKDYLMSHTKVSIVGSLAQLYRTNMNTVDKMKIKRQPVFLTLC